MSGAVLVTGATGKTGSLVAAALRERGASVRRAARTNGDVAFDWADPSTYAAALEGIARIYLVAPPMEADPSALMIPFVAQALRSGVRRFVQLSSSAITLDTPGDEPPLAKVERFLRDHAPEWTIVKPSWFMQNFVGRWHPHGASLLDASTVVTSTGHGRVGFVDARDIAAVAAEALLDETSGAHGTTPIVTGPEALSYDDVAAILTRVLGRPFRHVAVTDAEATARFGAAGLPTPVAAMLVGLDARIRDGAEDRVAHTVLQMTGRAPRCFEAFVRENAAAFARGGGAPDELKARA